MLQFSSSFKNTFLLGCIEFFAECIWKGSFSCGKPGNYLRLHGNRLWGGCGRSSSSRSRWHRLWWRRRGLHCCCNDSRGGLRGSRRRCVLVINQLLHPDDKVEVGPLIGVVPGLCEGRDENVCRLFRRLTVVCVGRCGACAALWLDGLQCGRHQTLKFVTRLTVLSIKQGYLIGVPVNSRSFLCLCYLGTLNVEQHLPGRHRLRPNVLYVGDEKIAVVGPSHLKGVNVLDNEPEEVGRLVPWVDHRPDVAPEKVLCSVEEHSCRLHRDGSHCMFGSKVWHYVSKWPEKRQWTLQLI